MIMTTKFRRSCCGQATVGGNSSKAGTRAFLRDTRAGARRSKARGARMFSRAEPFRRRGIVAQHRAAQANDKGNQRMHRARLVWACRTGGAPRHMKGPSRQPPLAASSQTLAGAPLFVIRNSSDNCVGLRRRRAPAGARRRGDRIAGFCCGALRR
jgi:hypothetical protein